MKKLAFLAFVLVLILSLILTIIVSFTIVSSEVNYIKIPEYTRSFTKAVCNADNSCQDYEIFCKDQKPVKITPITGAVVQFPDNWKDPRSQEMRNKWC